MKTSILAVIFTTAFSVIAQAQIQTLVVSPGNTNSPIINVGSNCVASVKAWSQDYGGTLNVNMQGINFSFDGSYEDLKAIVIAGPATIQLQGDNYEPFWATIEVKPGMYPPNKTAVVGSNAGNVQVTLQTSTDLVSWTTAVNGMTYSNCPEARFFRIQLLTTTP